MNQPFRLNTGYLIFFTALALIAFAFNSILNRLALGGNTIDASSYVSIRLMSGALALWLINGISKRDLSLFSTILPKIKPFSYVPAFYLFAYGVAFSYAYISLPSGTGAFILFGTVQITMLSSAILRGERPHFLEWTGLILAISGMAYLVFPGLSAPDPLGALLMLTAGIAWGLYTLKGKGVQDFLQTTTLNFIFTLPMVLILNIFTISHARLSSEGITYALISGSLTSGVGYSIWYLALRGLKTTQAALLQLLVPILAAIGGVIFLSENITTRLVQAGFMIIMGVMVAILGKRYWQFNSRR